MSLKRVQSRCGLIGMEQQDSPPIISLNIAWDPGIFFWGYVMMSLCSQVSSPRTSISCWVCQFIPLRICGSALDSLTSDYGIRSNGNYQAKHASMADIINHLWSLFSVVPLNPSQHGTLGSHTNLLQVVYEIKPIWHFCLRHSLYLGNECACTSWQRGFFLSFSAGAQLICWIQIFDFLFVVWILWPNLQLLVCTPIPLTWLIPIHHLDHAILLNVLVVMS